MLFARRARPSLPQRLRIAAWPRRSFRRSFVYYKHRVLRLEASPHAIAAGVAAGAFASCTPLVGFHFLLSFALAWLIGGSLIAAAFGTAVGNPLTFPFIWLSSFQLGEVILGRSENSVSPLDLEFSVDLMWNSFATLWPTLKPMLIGGVIIGSVVGGVLYVLVRSAVLVSRSLREARLQAAMESAAALRHARALDAATALRTEAEVDVSKSVSAAKD
ncbi:DUF2062 domain-containing protein [Acuticoccus mangrovi]|uniref:DUF2062 domain-containing protein n=1 Tax=Acuticoccus mangrovi TaxID=2796142 RepID=A0A934MIR8_9HYPH|nr:DUF2062 domain-containing protein [Acuticoccus mangrovi]MBJ3778195.1 DUF2062 domain-containing protein [Acuticoccus mangrovi]